MNDIEKNDAKNNIDGAPRTVVQKASAAAGHLIEEVGQKLEQAGEAVGEAALNAGLRVEEAGKKISAAGKKLGNP